MQCDICQDTFSSKNKLYDHLEISHGWEREIKKRNEKIVMIVGWLSDANDEHLYSKDGSLRALATPTDMIVEKSLWEALSIIENTVFADNDKIFTRGSGCAARATNLYGHEESCHGGCDTFTCFLKPSKIQRGSDWILKMNEQLGENIHVIEVYSLPHAAHTFHAESYCGQRVYEYMIPLDILVPTDPKLRAEQDAIFPHHLEEVSLEQRGSRRFCTMDIEFPGDTEVSLLRIKYFRILKRLLKRFGGKQSMHNYTTGGITSDDAVARRNIGRFYHKRLLLIDDREWVIFSVSGDSFLRGQVRKMMGIAVAVMRGWLPVDYAVESLEPTVIADIPSLPGGASYLSECKYDKWEAKFGMRIDPRRVEGADMCRMDHWLGVVQARSRLMWTHSAHDTFMEEFKKQCEMCLQRREIEKTLSNRILNISDIKPMENIHQGSESESIGKAYEKVLCLLRAACASGLWPLSSQGRQKVIEASSLVENGGEGGSFSIGVLPAHLAQPRGNELFPGKT